jgi:tRNA-splicing ligase RtcB
MFDLPRTGPASLKIPTANGLDITLFAAPDVPIDRASIEEIRSFSRLADTIEELRPRGFFGEVDASIERVVLTPDFHRGAGIPVGTVFRAHGFVVPKAVGNDIGCGMRLLTTDVSEAELARLDRRFETRLRHIFFEGGRDVGLTPRQREGVLRQGLQALIDARPTPSPTWRQHDPAAGLGDLMRTHSLGSFDASDVSMFEAFIRGSATTQDEITRDDQTGSIGGGNHFCEVLQVEQLFDGAASHAWGLAAGMVCIMAHSGSVGLGHQVGTWFMDQARDLHPEGRRPSHGFHMLPTAGPHGAIARRYLPAMRAAANFAIVNRFFLGLMMVRAMAETLQRPIRTRLVHDAPHNLIWSEDEHSHLHRKGACPALGPEAGYAEFPDGHPVIVPGSMGDSSYVLKGLGNVASYCSACHGAGRIAPRGAARRSDAAALDRIRLVGKIDPQGAAFRQRPDIVAEWQQTMLEEAPAAYKSITPVIDTVIRADIASPVARLRPILTVKG